MDRTGARGLPRTCARVALIIGAVLLLVPALAHAASVVLEWDRNSDGLTAGYYVYYGTQSGNYTGSVDVGSSTSAVVNLNDPNATYYFAVQAYSSTGEKSPLSPEIAWIQDVTSTGGTPTSGTPTSGTPSSGTPSSGTPSSGTPTGGTPTSGTPSGGTPSTKAPTLSNPGSMTGTVGQSVGLQLTATDPGGLALSYFVSGLPPGLVSAYGGIIYGIPTTAGAFNVTITVTNTLALSASQTFTWTISQPGSGGLPGGGGTGGTGGTPSSGGGGTVGGAPSGGGSGTGGGSGVGGGTTGSGGGSPAIQVPTQPAQDLTPPTVVFLSPAPVGGTARTNESRVIVTGIASDNVGVVSVTWASSRGASGAAFGTSSWVTGPIDLSMGDNVITITVADAAGNVRTATLTVTRYVDIQNFVN